MQESWDDCGIHSFNANSLVLKFFLMNLLLLDLLLGY